MVGLLRHLCRSKAAHGRKVLVLMDSMAALGVIGKGRSSSPPLLRLARQRAAYELAFDIYLTVRYIPSEVNPADGPSRGGPVGTDADTVRSHADRLTLDLSELLAKSRVPAPVDPGDVAALLSRAHACSGYAGG